jgi:endonuclease/exonuclease/phosphatase family metal-dependent hydrolase
MSYDCNLKVSFLTWNIYQGFESAPVFAAPPDQLPKVISQVYRQFLATNFPDRAKALAKAIACEEPDLIGLQEAVWIGLNIPTFRPVIYNFIEILLEALEELGLNYEVAARNKNAGSSLPDSNGNIVEFLERDAILIRKCNHMKVINKQQANFQSNLTIPLAGQPYTILRGWSYIDIETEGKVFRMINTHLDPTVENIRNEQALEILKGPANTCLPVIITGDLNATPSSTTYNLFVNEGFRDTWGEIGEIPGFTDKQSADLLNADSLLNRRIDYVLFKNGWEPYEVEVVGESQKDRTITGLWPSDHAGVSGTLLLKEHYGKLCDESCDE